MTGAGNLIMPELIVKLIAIRLAAGDAEKLVRLAHDMDDRPTGVLDRVTRVISGKSWSTLIDA
jgi:hypothetical protein